MFPPEFFSEIARLKKWENPLDSRNKVMNAGAHYGNVITDIIYSRLAPYIYTYLKNHRRVKYYHQEMSMDSGIFLLKQHIGKVLAYMSMYVDYECFIKSLNEKLPKFPQNINTPLISNQ